MQYIKGTILHTIKERKTINQALFQNSFMTFCLIDYALSLQEAEKMIWNSERMLGLRKLPNEMDDYFEIFENMSVSEFDKKTINVTLFESVKLKNGQIVRASDSFYNAPFYSDVSIQMTEEASEYESNDGKCYGKVSTIIIKKSYY
jgi:hypothetical protein